MQQFILESTAIHVFFSLMCWYNVNSYLQTETFRTNLYCSIIFPRLSFLCLSTPRYISLQKISWTYLPFNASLINASCLFYLNKYKYTRERCHVFYGWPVRSKQVVSWWHHHDIFSGINQNKWWHIYRYTFPVYKKNKKTNNIYEGVCMHRLSGVSIFIDNKKKLAMWPCKSIMPKN